VLCDEPTSALDVSVQAAILNLLADLQVTQYVAYLLISHDLGTVRYLADRIAVMYLGQVVDIGDAEEVFNAPHHPYTEALLSAMASVDAAEEVTRIRLSGSIPNPANPPSGCRFHTRCPRLIGEICRSQSPLAERWCRPCLSLPHPSRGPAPSAAAYRIQPRAGPARPLIAFSPIV
jgi:peptide/nickel transport system ATP-binding protein